MKTEVSQALQGIQRTNSRLTNRDNTVMNFDDEITRNDAAQQLEVIHHVITKSVKKIRQKIMICNVHKEETKNKIIKTQLRELRIKLSCYLVNLLQRNN